MILIILLGNRSIMVFLNTPVYLAVTYHHNELHQLQLKLQFSTSAIHSHNLCLSNYDELRKYVEIVRDAKKFSNYLRTYDVTEKKIPNFIFLIHLAQRITLSVIDCDIGDKIIDLFTTSFKENKISYKDLKIINIENA
jgi:hypothetical protein